MLSRSILCLLLILGLFAYACADGPDEGVLPVPEDSLSVDGKEGEGSDTLSSGRDVVAEQQISDDSGAQVVDRDDRVYLEGSIPPCSVDGGSGDNPCTRGWPSRRETKRNSASIGVITELNFLDILLVTNGPDTLGVHLVVRGVVKDYSTRCQEYPYILENFASDDRKEGFPSLNNKYVYVCFVDFIVSDYIVGEGPPLLTVAIYDTYPIREFFDEAISMGISAEEYLDYPQSWTAEEYEGKELVLFLTTSRTIAVESWWALDVWFAQKNAEGEIMFVARGIEFAINDEVRKQLIIRLEELNEGVQEAVVERNRLTDGRIGVDTRLPLAMTDAYELREYYEIAGAVYNTLEGATVLPPPVPGEGDPPPPTIPANEGAISSSIPAPGEETTVPPPTDDSGGQAEPSTTVTTETPATVTTTTTTNVTLTGTTTATTEPIAKTIVTEEPAITEIESTTTAVTTATTTIAGIEEGTGDGGPDEEAGTVVTLFIEDDTQPPTNDENSREEQTPGGQAPPVRR